MIFLASTSPRRAQLLRQIAVEFQPLPVDTDESAFPNESPDAYVARMAQTKAIAGREIVQQKNDAAVVLAADTIITIDGKIIGKPLDHEHCFSILKMLSGREHEVLSAIAVAFKDDVLTRLTTNKVRFKTLSDQEIEQYCESGEPFDKAGGYAIQGRGAIFVQHLSGSYSSVMGLPLYETAELLKQLGLSV